MENSFFIYLLKANIVLVVFYMAYLALFSRTTFHRSNRFVLLFILVFSMLSPLVKENPMPQKIGIPEFNEWVTDFENLPAQWQAAPTQPDKSFLSVPSILIVLYLAGVLVMLLRFLLQFVSVVRLRLQATKLGDAKGVFITRKGKLPFTFLRWIFLPRKKYSASDMALILKHENVHAVQLHSADIILAELGCVLFWFNPVMFLLKRTMRTVHEYLADAGSSAGAKADYLRLLARGVSYAPVGGMPSNFYWLTIKKRINMITKNKTSNLRRALYLLLIPAAMFIVQSFTISSTSVADVSGIKKNEVPSIMPINADNVKKTSGYGMRVHPVKKVEMMHNGVDFAAPTGTPVVATADGVVVKVEFKEEGKGYGRAVLVKHNEIYATLYTQLSEFKVKEGQKVKQGDVVGLVGSSGLSTGSHLHYEVHKNGERVNPEDYFE